MTWLRFKTLTLRLNLIVLIGGWLAFWGYGVAVGEVPPLSDVWQGLLALSLIAMCGVTVLSFIGSRLYLALRKDYQNPHRLSALSRYALIGLVIAILASTLASEVDLIPLWDEIMTILTFGIGLPSLGIVLFLLPTELAPRLFHWPKEG
ncbi:MAG: hypothetical protein KJ731_16440 [Alphaproteobacteria bacterium]|nr:hypothetical protein [Alphaproteobacteria bacterium]MBU1278484.1 hypothetical protein [Alphaproteobacteria bacterium]MBU1573337.1 hypothetical protein [Alphaproteobacteria bacterium]MBU1830037.1 hypothetical protein [Alphaproteobacteria bacterium]MBU2241224.1 hypothetical protein [Alphaproteobacteria bacterium]